MSNKHAYDGIREQLEAERSQLTKKTDGLRDQLMSLEENLARVEAALAALFGPESPSANGKSSKKKRTLGPSASKEQLIGFIIEQLSTHKSLAEDALKDRVEKQLAALGFTRIGFSRRFSEALADSKFNHDENHVGLKE